MNKPGDLELVSGRVLAVGCEDYRERLMYAPQLGACLGLNFVTYREFQEGALSSFLPDTILSPLFGHRFDAVEVAEFLKEAGFGGRFRALSEVALSPAVIRADIRRAAPQLDFDVLLML